jgi:hypothetical protein
MRFITQTQVNSDNGLRIFLTEDQTLRAAVYQGGVAIAVSAIVDGV